MWPDIALKNRARRISFFFLPASYPLEVSPCRQERTMTAASPGPHLFSILTSERDVLVRTRKDTFLLSKKTNHRETQRKLSRSRGINHADTVLTAANCPSQRFHFVAQILSHFCATRCGIPDPLTNFTRAILGLIGPLAKALSGIFIATPQIFPQLFAGLRR
jgi:hypothetical protein